jgi:hypothetical protein
MTDIDHLRWADRAQADTKDLATRFVLHRLAYLYVRREYEQTGWGAAWYEDVVYTAGMPEALAEVAAYAGTHGIPLRDSPVADAFERVETEWRPSSEDCYG